ncbi:hypothetical protein ACFRJ8_15140 [Arthrobacter sp. NPDC056886]|uniref:hypothetical protein n=1 Tax=Arthrobacter sp. NPDC056886 TaxID=3345960 RepID=UPI00366CB45F
MNITVVPHALRVQLAERADQARDELSGFECTRGACPAGLVLYIRGNTGIAAEDAVVSATYALRELQYTIWTRRTPGARPTKSPKG